MATRLGEKDGVDAFPGLALGEFQRAVRAFAGRLVIDDGTLDDTARRALAAPDDRELAAGVLADEDVNLGGADLDGADKGGAGAHGEVRCGEAGGRMEKTGREAGGRAEPRGLTADDASGASIRTGTLRP